MKLIDPEEYFLDHLTISIHSNLNSIIPLSIELTNKSHQSIIRDEWDHNLFRVFNIKIFLKFEWENVFPYQYFPTTVTNNVALLFAFLFRLLIIIHISWVRQYFLVVSFLFVKYTKEVLWNLCCLLDDFEGLNTFKCFSFFLSLKRKNYT